MREWGNLARIGFLYEFFPEEDLSTVDWRPTQFLLWCYRTHTHFIKSFSCIQIHCARLKGIHYSEEKLNISPTGCLANLNFARISSMRIYPSSTELAISCYSVVHTQFSVPPSLPKTGRHPFSPRVP